MDYDRLRLVIQQLISMTWYDCEYSCFHNGLPSEYPSLHDGLIDRTISGSGVLISSPTEHRLKWLFPIEYIYIPS